MIKAQNPAVTTGPEKGSLIIAGGGSLSDEIMQKFIDLAGGTESRIVVIPTASGSNNITEDSGGAERLRMLGVKDVQVLHTYDKEEADQESFASVLKDAGGVWFSGGRQWRLVDAYKGTMTEELIWDVLNRGGVVGGSSAGATIQGSYLARGDTKNNQVMMGDHEEGLAFVKNIAIDQHVIARNRHFDMFSILKNRPELLGISIDEGTAVVVQGNEFEVMGPRYVIIFDGTFWSREGIELKELPPSDELFYFLREGDRYNMKDRRVIDLRR
jgi:cyanophycinase